MPTPSDLKTQPDPTGAAAHIASARQILTALQEKLGEHPELGAAITKLEMALNDLAIQTGGML
jgi:CO dehydrogenase/acetyl-CoA synthase alpha subunit